MAVRRTDAALIAIALGVAGSGCGDGDVSEPGDSEPSSAWEEWTAQNPSSPNCAGGVMRSTTGEGGTLVEPQMVGEPGPSDSFTTVVVLGRAVDDVSSYIAPDAGGVVVPGEAVTELRQAEHGSPRWLAVYVVNHNADLPSVGDDGSFGGDAVHHLLATAYGVDADEPMPPGVEQATTPYLTTCQHWTFLADEDGSVQEVEAIGSVEQYYDENPHVTPESMDDVAAEPDGNAAEIAFHPVLGVADDDTAASEDEIVVTDETGIPLRLGSAVLTADDIDAASAEVGEFGWIVAVEFSGDGEDRWQQLTAEAACFRMGDPQRRVAITVDGELLSSPEINTTVQCDVGIAGGSMQITGDFDEESAKELAASLGE